MRYSLDEIRVQPWGLFTERSTRSAKSPRLNEQQIVGRF